MTDLTRRQALASAVLAGGGALLGSSIAHAGTRDSLPQIPVLRSRNGVLRAAFAAAAGPAPIDGTRTAGLWTYDGSFVGPCLRVAPGDRVDLTVRNRVSVPINTHFHGWWVDPSGDADNVFVEAQPGAAIRSRLTLPRTHPRGLFWYHPHVHGYTNESVWNGLSGPIIVEGGVESLPQYRGCRDRLLAFKGFALDPQAATPTMLSVEKAGAPQVVTTTNGVVNPTMVIRPGETQIWRMGNMANDGFLRIALDGHSMTVLAIDGVTVFDTWQASEVILAPGARAEVAVTGASEPGTYTLRTLGYDNGPFGQWQPQALATVKVEGPRATPVKAPTAITPRPAWLHEKPVKRRTFTLSESFSDTTGPLFYINGKVFDHQDMHDPFEVVVDTVEEWVVRNDPAVAQGGAVEGHPFHIHVNHFAVVGRGRWDPATGKTLSHRKVEPRALEDTEQVLPNEYVVLKMKFRKFTGKTVFHCHILFHEDLGMMGAFRIVEKDNSGGAGGHEHGH
jgi:FtsP/CotA-like multicopper oxidase with cupredoxin domain